PSIIRSTRATNSPASRISTWLRTLYPRDLTRTRIQDSPGDSEARSHCSATHLTLPTPRQRANCDATCSRSGTPHGRAWVAASAITRPDIAPRVLAQSATVHAGSVHTDPSTRVVRALPPLITATSSA